MTLELTRNEIRNLLMACTHASIASREDTEKWDELFFKIKEQFDKNEG